MSWDPVIGFSQNRISNIDTAPTFSITNAGAVFFSVSGNDVPRQISLAKSNIQIKPAAERKVMTMVAEREHGTQIGT